jgi:glycosyltransferase involved in cell wall biosynthesis
MTGAESNKVLSEENRSAVRLNVGIIIPALEKYGGAERYLVECVKRWQHRHEITIYASAFNNDLLGEIGIGPSVKLVELSPNFEGDHSFLLNAVLLPKLWRQRIGRHDVYHTHLWPTHTVDLHPMVWFPHEPLRLLHDLKFEQQSNDSGVEGLHQLHVYPKYSYDHVSYDLYDAYRATIDTMDRAARPEYVVANSQYTADYLAQIYGHDIPHVVYPGADADSFIDLRIDRKLFVTISQLWPHKRVNLLIEAIALTDETQLIVIGSGPELDRLQSLCVKLGVEDRVFFQSGLSNFEVRLVLARACALLFCPIREPFGIVVLEAMAAGKPIIATNEGGYVEVCDPEFALLIPPSPLIFAEKIEFLRDNPQHARIMGEAARKAAAQYSWRRTADELENLLVKASVEAKLTRVRPLPQDRTRPLVGIQYYLWYGDGFGTEHWNDNSYLGHVGDHPFLGYYASEKGQTIEYHLSQFEAMNLDFVILNLHVDGSGPNRLEVRSIRNLFEISAARNSRLRFAIQISPFDASPEQIGGIISLVRELSVDRDQYLRIDGKPALFWFWSSAHDGNRMLLESMREMAADFRNFAFGLRLPKGVDESRYTFGFFEGFGLYSPLEVSSEENWDRVWKSAYEASHSAGLTYRMASVSPGYDDRSLLDPRRVGNPYRAVPRRNGDTYARSLGFVESLANPPHIVVVSTFNEYHENTHIESSSGNGGRYIEMTRESVDRIHAKVLDRDSINE